MDGANTETTGSVPDAGVVPLPEDRQGQDVQAGQDQKEQAKQEAKQTAQKAQEQAGQVADTAKSEAGQVVEEAKMQARNLVGEAKDVGRARAQEQTDRLTQGLQQLHGQACNLIDGKPEEAGALGDYAQQLVDRLGDYAERADELGFDGMMREASKFARRRPGMFLLAAGGAGLLVGRLGRGMKDAGSGDSQSALPSSTRPASGNVSGSSDMSGTSGMAAPGIAQDDVVIVESSPGSGPSDYGTVSSEGNYGSR
jgi:hypothetical protein